MTVMLIRTAYFIVVCLTAKSVSSSSDVHSSNDNLSVKLGQLEGRNLIPLDGDHQDKNDDKRLLPPPPPPAGGSSSGNSSSSSNHNDGGGRRNAGGSDSTESAGSLAGDNAGLLAGAGIIMIGVFAATAACERPKESINVRVSSIEAIGRKASNDLEPGTSHDTSIPDGCYDEDHYKIMRDGLRSEMHIDARISCLENFRRKTHADTTAIRQYNESINVKSSNYLQAHARNISNDATACRHPNGPINARISKLDPQMMNEFTDLDPDAFNVGLRSTVPHDEVRYKIRKEGADSELIPVVTSDKSYDPPTRDGNRYELGKEGLGSKLIPDVTSDVSYDPSTIGMTFFESASDISYDAPTFSSSNDGDPYRAA